MSTGGFSEAKSADKNVKAIANEVRLKVEKALGLNFSEFDAIQYKTQIVNGTNYKIKIQVANRKYIHIKVFVPLPGKKGKIQLLEQAGGKNLEDPL